MTLGASLQSQMLNRVRLVAERDNFRGPLLRSDALRRNAVQIRVLCFIVPSIRFHIDCAEHLPLTTAHLGRQISADGDGSSVRQRARQSLRDSANTQQTLQVPFNRALATRQMGSNPVTSS